MAKSWRSHHKKALYFSKSENWKPRILKICIMTKIIKIGSFVYPSSKLSHQEI